MQKFRVMRVQRGFTLMELLIVMAILGMLAAVVVPNIWGRFGTAKRDAAATQIRSIEAALDSYRLDNTKYPKSLDALIRNAENAKFWQGPYLKQTEKIPSDPWGNPYQYKSPGRDKREYDLYAFGADGAEGGEGENADVTSWGTK